MDQGLGASDFVLDGDHAPSTPPKMAHVYCGQTAGWMKLVLGVEVGLSPGDIVLDEDPALPCTKGVDFVLNGDPAPPSQKGAEPSKKFWPMFIAARRLDG